jgi:tRNA pseudouridine38-40 synthase
VQPGTRTVQGQIEKCLRWLVQSDIRITGAGRTDAGVHALGQVAHFDTEMVLPLDFGPRLNAALPDDICVLQLEDCAPDFHARYSAVRKTYRYRLAYRPSAFAAGLAWRIADELDWSAVETATALLIGKNDFAGFCRVGSLKDDCTCDVTTAFWQRGEREACFEIAANRFLHRMVRLIVGTLVDIGRHRWPPGHLREILSAGDVRLAGQAAPPEGLYLVRVEYP